MSCQLSCKWFSLSQRIGVMAHPATQQIQNVSVALCCAAIILPRFLFQGSPRPPGIYRTWKGRTKTVLFPGPGSSAVVGDDGMNQFDLQSALHILVNADMRLSAAIIKRSGTQLVYVAVIIPQDTLHGCDITGAGCVDHKIR